MKEIVHAKISRFELASILFAARWQMQDWKKASADKNNDTWDFAIEATKYLERFMKDFPQDNYYIRTFEHDL